MSRVFEGLLFKQAVGNPFRSYPALLALVLCAFSLHPSLSGQTVPNYQWWTQEPLPTVNASTLNTDDLTIAMATDGEGNVYTLTFGNGIQKRNSDGTLIQENFISGTLLDNPRDLAVDEEGFLYVADYLAGGETFQDNGKIKVFDSLGTYREDRTVLTSYYRPLGLDVKGDKIYVAEYYDGLQGPEKGSTFSRVRIYDKNNHLVVEESEDFSIPLRIAVNSTGHIYVSQAGESNKAVVILDPSLNRLGQLPALFSPGSVVVDASDYVHVIEYGSRLDFSEFINFGSLGFGEVLGLAEDIYQGTQNKEFFVKVFSPEGNLVNQITDQVAFPVDIASEPCERFYINNATIFGSYTFLGYTPSRLTFDLEIFKRNPSLDSLHPPEITCPMDIQIELTPEQNEVRVEFEAPVASDVCGVRVTQTLGQPSGSFFAPGQHELQFTAEDTAGNRVTCSFFISVRSPDLPPSFESCPSGLELAAGPGDCGAYVDYEIPQASDEQGAVAVEQVEGLPPGALFPVGTTRMEFEARDTAGNTSTCSFSIRVLDEQPPLIHCPGDFSVQLEYGASASLVNYALPDVSDNCTGVKLEQVSGLPSGAEFPLGITENTFVATDASGNKTSCSFRVEVLEEPDEIPPELTCPDAISFRANEACSSIVEYALPEATDNSGEARVVVLEGYKPGELSPIGSSTVTLQAIDASGNTTTCSFRIHVLDEVAPEIQNCPGDQQVNVESLPFSLPDYTSFLNIVDCSEVTQVVQSPRPGTLIDSSSQVDIYAEDSYGNRSAICSFQVILHREALQIVSCPEPVIAEVASNCSFTLPDYSGEVETNFPSSMEQRPVPGTEIFEETVVVLTATDPEGRTDQCEVQVTLEDTEAPEITCPGERTFSFDPDQGFEVPDFREELEVFDSCGYLVEQDPQPGSLLYAGREVVLTARDNSGNERSCQFELVLHEAPVEEPIKILNCPSSFVLELGAGCKGVVPDLGAGISTNISAEISQSPKAGTEIFEETLVVLTATDPEGQTDQCEVQVNLEDTQAPEITCPGERTFSFDSDQGFEVPDFREELEVFDSCGYLVEQDPEPGSLLYAGREVVLTARDNSGNERSCQFELVLHEAPVEQSVTIYSCPDSIELELSTNCLVALPDLRNRISTNISAEIVQNPLPGTPISQETEVTLIATDPNGNQDTCSFPVTPIDKLGPLVACPGDLEVETDLAQGYRVPDYTAGLEVMENCETYTVRQIPSPGSLVHESQEVHISVWDENGNETNCTFLLELSDNDLSGISCPPDQKRPLDSNCSYVLEDFRPMIEVNNEEVFLEQDPVPGTVLSADTIVKITAHLADRKTSCEFRLVVQDKVPPEIFCKENVEVILDEGGYASLSVGDITTGFSDNCRVVSSTLSKSDFTRDDLGTQRISYTVTDIAGNQSTCEIRVTVREAEEPPVSIQCVSSYTLPLGSEGRVRLLPEDLYDGHGESFEVALDKEIFTCEDLGEQMITLTAETPQGMQHCEVSLYITDPGNFCSVPEDEPTDRDVKILLLPNPSAGKVVIYTAEAIVVEHVEVFDFRGRFLKARDFSQYTPNSAYELDLREYQSGVYTIRIVTDEGDFVKRAIILND